jgi:hypothetical protein
MISLTDCCTVEDYVLIQVTTFSLNNHFCFNKNSEINGKFFRIGFLIN